MHNMRRGYLHSVVPVVRGIGRTVSRSRAVISIGLYTSNRLLYLLCPALILQLHWVIQVRITHRLMGGVRFLRRHIWFRSTLPFPTTRDPCEIDDPRPQSGDQLTRLKERGYRDEQGQDLFRPLRTHTRLNFSTAHQNSDQKRTWPKLKENFESYIGEGCETFMGNTVNSVVQIHMLMGMIPTVMKNTYGYRRPIVCLFIQNIPLVR